MQLGERLALHAMDYCPHCARAYTHALMLTHTRAHTCSCAQIHAGEVHGISSRRDVRPALHLDICVAELYDV